MTDERQAEIAAHRELMEGLVRPWVDDPARTDGICDALEGWRPPAVDPIATALEMIDARLARLEEFVTRPLYVVKGPEMPEDQRAKFAEAFGALKYDPEGWRPMVVQTDDDAAQKPIVLIALTALLILGVTTLINRAAAVSFAGTSILFLVVLLAITIYS